MKSFLAPAREVCAARLDRLTRVLGLAGRAAEFTGVFETMTASWGDAAAGDLAESDVSSDGSPAEFAVDLDAVDPAVQFAVEPISRGDSPSDRAMAARSLMAELADAYGVSDERWSSVADLFLPEDPAAPHAAMYGAEVRARGPVGFKVWFYPSIGGEERAVELVERGLGRLGLRDAWPSVAAHMARAGDVDRPVLFALDLSGDAAARVKVYFRHHEADADDIATLMARYPAYSHGPVLDFCRQMTDGETSLARQPPVTCLSFTSAHPGRVSAAALYMPMWTYAPDDAEVRARVAGLVTDPARYDDVLREVAGRPLDRGRGIHNYVSWRPGNRHPRVKVYLSPELHHVDPMTRYRFAATR